LNGDKPRRTGITGEVQLDRCLSFFGCGTRAEEKEDDDENVVGFDWFYSVKSEMSLQAGCVSDLAKSGSITPLAYGKTY
jgi:hypothetical protein